MGGEIPPAIDPRQTISDTKEVPETGPLDQSSSQSADAARAARMSRVGTKAGRNWA